MTNPVARSVAEWRAIVMRAYEAQPTLNLTTAQGQRLWGMDPTTCGYVLDALIEAGVLARTSSGRYCRADLACTLEPVGDR